MDSDRGQRSRTFLYAIGLGILKLFKTEEPPKVLIRKSRRTALAHCAVHILPSCVSAILLTINLLGYFIGFELQGLNIPDEAKFGLLQVAAKLQVPDPCRWRPRRPDRS